MKSATCDQQSGQLGHILQQIPRSTLTLQMCLPQHHSRTSTTYPRAKMPQGGKVPNLVEHNLVEHPHTAFGVEYRPVFKHCTLICRKPQFKAKDTSQSLGCSEELDSRTSAAWLWTGATLTAETTSFSPHTGDATTAGFLHLVRCEHSPLTGQGCGPGSHLSFRIFQEVKCKMPSETPGLWTQADVTDGEIAEHWS